MKILIQLTKTTALAQGPLSDSTRDARHHPGHLDPAHRDEGRQARPTPSFDTITAVNGKPLKELNPPKCATAMGSLDFCIGRARHTRPGRAAPLPACNPTLGACPSFVTIKGPKSDNPICLRGPDIRAFRQRLRVRGPLPLIMSDCFRLYAPLTSTSPRKSGERERLRLS